MAGTVVSQDDIMNEIWGERVVAQNSIQRCIAQIRKALNDSSKEQRYIKTHPKLGYSLDAQVTWHNENQVEIADEIDKTPETKLNQSHWVGNVRNRINTINNDVFCVEKRQFTAL